MRWIFLDHIHELRPGEYIQGEVSFPPHLEIFEDHFPILLHILREMCRELVEVGEAVGIAAAFNSLDRYPDDASLDFDFDFNLRGVIAIAPVYGQYEPRERPTPVRDINYFTIHGDMDGDVQSFEGVGQYSRVGFSG